MPSYSGQTIIYIMVLTGEQHVLISSGDMIEQFTRHGIPRYSYVISM